MSADLRSVAREIFLQSLAECSIEKAFERHVYYERGVLRIAEDLYDVSSSSRVFVLSIGKAAHTMAQALAARMGELTGIVAMPAAPSPQSHGLSYFFGGHPLPNQDSIRAAEAALRSLNALDSQSFVIFLLSGGGSAIFEKPLDDEISLDDLIATYRVLVHSGAPIAEINAVRKHLSAVKGGRLAKAAEGAQQVSVMISDVPDNALDALASGPTMPDCTTVEDCYRIAERYALLEQFPASVRELFVRHALEETPKSDDPAFVRSRWWPILTNANIREAAAARASAAGFAVEVDDTCDDWDYAQAADYLLNRLRELRRGVSRVCLISGGEVTVSVPANPGTGGRNQQFVLHCAQRIAAENILVLSAGTDGIDGNSPAAGAIADGTTTDRARSRGLDPTQSEAKFDAYSFFDDLGDTIVTGPTGNNIRDLRILLAY